MLSRERLLLGAPRPHRRRSLDETGRVPIGRCPKGQLTPETFAPRDWSGQRAQPFQEPAAGSNRARAEAGSQRSPEPARHLFLFTFSRSVRPQGATKFRAVLDRLKSFKK